MPQALLFIGANTGCTRELMQQLGLKEGVESLWQIASGSYDVVALVRGEDVIDLFSFKEELGNLQIYDGEQKRMRPLVDHVSFNLVFPDSSSAEKAGIIPPPKRLS